MAIKLRRRELNVPRADDGEETAKKTKKKERLGR